MNYPMLILFLLSLASLSYSHIVLTFPPARSYLDFLDNVRTEGPCGSEKDPGDPVTALQPGQEINVTWHISYAHRGGFYIELMQDGMVYNLTEPGGEFISVDDATKLQQTVTIPANVMGNATLRIVRHAAEWLTNNPDVPYLFWSCADLLIDDTAMCNKVGDETPCSNRGTCTNGKCECNRLSFGEYCQYEDICANTADCNDHGQCHDILATSYPKRQCYCEDGFFGIKCEKENPSDFTININKNLFFKRMINDEIKLYYRILEDEIEIAVEAKTNTWLGIGWRPAGLTDTCKDAFGDGWVEGGDAEPEPEAETNNRRRRQSGNEIVIREKYTGDTNCGSNGGNGGPEPEGEGNPEPEAEGSPEPEAEGSPEPEAEGTPEPEAEGTPEPEAEGTPEPEGEGTPEPEPEGEGEAEPEGEAPAGGPLHPMDCMDIVIGMAHGTTSNIADYYTLDRSTPLRDSMYGGTDDLVAAGGKEEDGTTTIVFRKKLQDSDPADHDIMNEPMTVIWARGQEYGAYVHSPASSIEACTASIDDYYRQDELKYHGTHNEQRGRVQDLNFFVDPESSECSDMVSLPPGCTGSACDYKVEWTLLDGTNDIRFRVTAKVEDGMWSGVGFSPNGQMIGSDAVLGWVDNDDGGAVQDFFLGDKGSNVLADTQQDVEDMVAEYTNGVLSLEFTKNGMTSDDKDVRLSGECVFLLMPDVGGPVNDGQPGFHTATPKSTQEKICFTPCEEEDPFGDPSASVSVYLTSWLTVMSALFCYFLKQ
ncbi:uncharacterized protein [Antedon mediterranea]|uniref:uncharacterized protein n=1 Tax=Antedon mediterranea TaxID=105859 RepID=UPI003AF842CA